MLVTHFDPQKALRFGFFVAALASPWFVDWLRSAKFVTLPKSALRVLIIVALTAIFAGACGVLFILLAAFLNGLAAGIAAR